MVTQLATRTQEPYIAPELFGQSEEKYQALCERKQAASKLKQLVLTSFSISLSVDKGALVIKDGPHPTRLYKGVHGYDSIILLCQKGDVTLDALNWCQSEDVCVSILNFDGSLKQCLTSEQSSNAKLRRKQYTCDPARVGYALVKRKAEEQYSFLLSQAITKSEQGLSDQTRAIQIFSDSLTWIKLPDLPRWDDVDYIRTFEGRLSKAYWYCFEQAQLKWQKADCKIIPPHWIKAGTRGSTLSKNHGARKAVSPFHCLLNYAYAVLESKVRQALVKQGFDITCAFLHTDKMNRDSLVYDLMELYRSKVDKLVLDFIQKTTFKRGNFLPISDGSVRISPELARFVVLSCSLSQDEIDKGAVWLRDLVLSL